MMKGSVPKTALWLLALLVLFPFLCWLLFAPAAVGELSLLDEGPGIAMVPPEVRAEAEALAAELFGSGPGQGAFVDGLLDVYAAAVDKDFILIFNSGGSGKRKIGPEWGSIYQGIESELTAAGYATLSTIYTRTPEGLLHTIKETSEMFHSYPSKAEPLAAEIDFLTENIEGIHVILLGESSGGIFNLEVMRHLQANPQVYSIETGVPFYYYAPVPGRSLVINDNGVEPDAFSSGDFWAIVRSNLIYIPTYRPEEGHLLYFLRAPGHIYTWDHCGVRAQVAMFLYDNF